MNKRILRTITLALLVVGCCVFNAAAINYTITEKEADSMSITSKIKDTLLLRNLKTRGQTPSLDLLQKNSVYSVFDSDGKEIELFESTCRTEHFSAKDGEQHMQSGRCKSAPADEVCLPQGNVYVNCLKSGRYVELDGVLYAVFDSGFAEKVEVASMWFAPYGTILQTADGTPYDAGDQKAAAWAAREIAEPRIC